ncbi:2Fe-2S iron-sulfur cluster-binding protein [Kribbella sp. NPDC051620]|uniref:2Fe-2S iron-sulfur cluster-binding protein n=1 Tax=Kribbella sp. NPDC051620 TaxID=3364120 RepID=UPI0037B09998
MIDVVDETPDARSISFEVPVGLDRRFVHAPGQFLTLAVPSDQCGVVARCYSLSSSPRDGGPLTVTVKRTAGGYASNWLCDNVQPGTVIRVLPPAGTFTPTSLDADLLLLAGGSGITPVMSILRSAVAAGSGRIALFYANRDEHSVIFGREIDELAERCPERFRVVHWLENTHGLPGPADIEAFSMGKTSWHAYCCGPTPFMSMALGALAALGIPKDRRRHETFVSLKANPFGSTELLPAPGLVQRSATGPVATPDLVRLEVELDGTVHVFDDWRRDTTLVEHMESKGIKVPYSCREGECSACAVTLLDGEVAMANNDILDESDLEDGTRLACQARPVTDVVRVTYS